MTQPTLTVELGYLSGWTLGTSLLGTSTYLATVTYSQDISADVRSVSIRRGRQHELNRVEAGTASVMVLNQDGAMTRIPPMTSLRIRATLEDAPVWSPADITGMVGWYDFSVAASNLWQDTARTSAVNADGQTIKGVTDKSGNGQHLSEATNGPTYKTAIVGSLSVARFDGSNDVLAPATNPNSGGAGTMFYVQKIVSEGVANASPWCDAGSSGSSDHHCFSDGNIYDGFGATARKTVGNPAPSLTSFYAFGVVSAASDYRAYVAGGTPLFSTGTNTVGWNASPPKMGKNLSGNFTNGDMAEVLLYNSALSTANINLVGNYLAAKWGITWTAV